jgi:UDP-N-acetylmuramoyl-L-alanyl-D-glutamate--2,6-diaminopimelate ligase
MSISLNRTKASLLVSIADLVNEQFDFSSVSNEKTFELLSSDSRVISKNSIFVAIHGETVDGHTFITQAIDNGADLVIAEVFTEDQKTHAKANKVDLVKVGNTRLAYTKICFQWWGNPQNNLKVAAITGTNGKTTVATILWQLLNKAGIKADLLSTAGKVINGIKTTSRLTTADPFELAKDFSTCLEAGSQVVVMEASSHALDQERVAAIQFSVAGFTNLSRDHLDYHGTMEAYANAKYKLFKNLNSKAVAVINADDEYAQLMAKTAAKTCLFSFKDEPSDNVDISCSVKGMSPEGMTFIMGDFELKTHLIGAFNAKNIVTAWQMAKVLGADEKLMQDATEHLLPAAGRMEFIGFAKDSKVLPLVIVDYAHTPDAMDNTLSAIHSILDKDRKLWVVFGCGGDRDRGKRPEMAAVSQKYAHFVVLTQDNPRTEDPSQIMNDILQGFSDRDTVQVIQSRKEAIIYAVQKAAANDLILILGKGHETYQEIDGIRHHFDDCEEALIALEARSQQLQKEVS